MELEQDTEQDLEGLGQVQVEPGMEPVLDLEEQGMEPVLDLVGQGMEPVLDLEESGPGQEEQGMVPEWDLEESAQDLGEWVMVLVVAMGLEDMEQVPIIYNCRRLLLTLLWLCKDFHLYILLQCIFSNKPNLSGCFCTIPSILGYAPGSKAAKYGRTYSLCIDLQYVNVDATVWI